MGFWHRARETFSFSDIPTTALAVLIYFLVFSSVLYTDELSSVPKPRKQGGLNLTVAYEDLHAITARPHPYAVRANDDVRAYLLSRVKQIAARNASFISVSDDLVSNATWTGGLMGEGIATYFEGTNILVKVDGSDPKYVTEHGAVLFSAHYDSVSTASGTTDDGMGVATLVQLVEYLATHRPMRTAVFNINNGEEDGLHGAHVFMEHSWAQICSTFVNLEGAAAGGRPLLWRASSYAPLKAYKAAHPHANVFSQDGYKRGMLKSYTDYEVYVHGNGTSGTGMEGLDIAFYKGRSKYHTKLDAIPYTDGGRRALWAMMDAARGVGVGLLNGRESNKRDAPALYFDVLGYVLVALPLHWFVILDIVLLVLGPIVVLGMLLLVIAQATAARHAAGMPPLGWGGAKGLIMALLGWARFWIALGVALVLHVLLCFTYTTVNPYIVHSHPLLVLVNALAISYLGVVVPLKFAHLRPGKTLPPSSSRQQKLATTLETFVFTWILLVIATVCEGQLELGGMYWVTAWYTCALLGSVIGLVEAWVRAHKGKGKTDIGPGVGQESVTGHEEHGNDRYLVHGVRYEVGGTSTGATDLSDGQDIRARVNGDGSEAQEGAVVETAPTEITPLMHQHRRSPSPSLKNGAEDQDELLWWIIQMLLLIPIPVLLVSQLGLFSLLAIGQTGPDGGKVVTLYALASFWSFIAILPLAPFAHKMHHLLTTIIAIIFVVSAIYAYSAAPFTQQEQMKVYFQQSLELQPHGHVKAVTKMTGLGGYLDDRILPGLPSAWHANISCAHDDLRGNTLAGCSWDSDLIPSPGRRYGPTDASDLAVQPRKAASWLDYTVTRTNATSVRITLAGTNSRACRVYFDSHSVTSYVVHGSTGALQAGYDDAPEGVSLVKLWSRSWGRTFVLDASWPNAGSEPLRGRVACEWAEYESGAAGGNGFGGRIPALEEALAFVPNWALVTKRMEGLVEAWAPFEV